MKRLGDDERYPLLTVTRRRRLRILANFLEAFEETDDHRFDMMDFGSAIKEPSAETNYCGTSACALGWAATIPALQRDGLVGQWCYSSHGHWYQRIHLRGKRIRDTYVTAARFFGLSYNEAADVFGGSLFSRAAVVKQLRELMA